MKKGLLVLLLVAAAMVAVPFSASATCSTYGKINYTVAYTTGMYVYVSPLSTSPYTPGYTIYYWIPNSFTAAVTSAVSAVPANTTIFITGNAASCPATTPTKNGGTATELRLVPGY
jgi:hypothetical protein